MPNGDKERAVDNQVVLYVARICMPVLISMLMAVMAWSLNRLVAASDARGKEIEEMSRSWIEMKTFFTSVRAQRDAELAVMRAAIFDHEGRIRTLEGNSRNGR